jgi:phage repressor protein C with HTH and peptisase S24 domain
MPETVADRIRSRLEVVGLKPQTASRLAGGSPSLIPNILNGRSKHPRIDTLNKIAPVLRTTGEWLMNGGPEPEPSARARIAAPMENDVEVRGTVLGAIYEGVEGFRFEGGPVDYVRRPPALAGARNAYAVYVRGDSQAPADPDGALRYVHPDRPIKPGDTVIVTTSHWPGAPEQSYIKVFRRRTANELILEQYNPHATIRIPVKYVASVHRVLTLNELFGV